jgi:HEAT repeat protein
MATFNEKLQAAGRGNPPAVSALTFLDDLNSEDRATLREGWPTLPLERRRYIIKQLADIAETNIDMNFRHVFLVGLQDEDADVRVAAIEGLFEDESRLLLGRLLDILRRDPEDSVREAAASALGRFTYIAHCGDKLGEQGDKLRQTLLDSANDDTEEASVRRRAVESLGYFQGDPRVEKLIADAYESGGQQAESAVFAMGRSMDPRWEQVVLDELESSRAAMRYEAARAAGEMTLADALPFLSRMIRDRDSEVKLMAIWALGQIGGKPATEALNEALRSNEPAVREAAQEAMDEIAFNSNPLDVGR